MVKMGWADFARWIIQQHINFLLSQFHLNFSQKGYFRPRDGIDVNLICFNFNRSISPLRLLSSTLDPNSHTSAPAPKVSATVARIIVRCCPVSRMCRPSFVPLSDIDWDELVISHSTNPVAWFPMPMRNRDDKKYDLLLETKVLIFLVLQVALSML